MQKTFFYIISLLILFTLAAGCAPKKPGSKEKIGMHFDAVLEFVVEYPLTWEKDRRLPYNSVNGEVRWTHPEYPGVMLKIVSRVSEAQEKVEDAAYDRVTAEYPHIEFTRVEERVVNETPVTFIEGHVRQLTVQSFVIYENSRSYLIALERPSANQEDLQVLLDKVVNSFKAIPKH